MNTAVFKCMHAVANCSVLQIVMQRRPDVDLALVKKSSLFGTMGWQSRLQATRTPAATRGEPYYSDYLPDY
jgi:hypothetical protein